MVSKPISPPIAPEEVDKQRSLHPYTALARHLETGPTIMTEGKGVMVRDNRGREYIDAMAGLWCVNIGWGRQEMVDAIAAQASKLAYFHSFSSMANEPAVWLADRVLRLAPKNLSKVFFGCSGSDANDTNVKLVWYYNNLLGRPKKKKIISRHRGYHGVTVATASLSGLSAMHRAFDLPIPQVLHTDTPHYYRGAEPGMTERDFSKHLANRLEQLILEQDPETVAAFIAEPVMGAGGVMPPPEGYFDEIRKVLERYDVLLIADEVICGFGRLGRWFGCDVYGLEPDLMTVAKGISSGYVPISGSLVSESIWKVLVEATSEVGYFAHGFTYSGHPLAAAAALANIDILEREDLPGNAARVGAHFQRGLRSAFADHPLVGEVRGLGLLAAVELVRDKATKDPFPLDLAVAARLSKLCMAEGLISRALPQSNALSFSPPLVITAEQCDLVVERFGRALSRLTDELVREGTWRG